MLYELGMLLLEVLNSRVFLSTALGNVAITEFFIGLTVFDI